LTPSQLIKESGEAHRLSESGVLNMNFPLGGRNCTGKPRHSPECHVNFLLGRLFTFPFMEFAFKVILICGKKINTAFPLQ
jgi:hypothetical protein